MSAAVFAAALQVLSLAYCYFHVVVVLVSGVGAVLFHQVVVPFLLMGLLHVIYLPASTMLG